MAKPDTAFWLIDDGRDFSISFVAAVVSYALTGKLVFGLV